MIYTGCTAGMPPQMSLASEEPYSTIPRRQLHPGFSGIRDKTLIHEFSSQPVHRLIGIQARRPQQPHCPLCTGSPDYCLTLRWVMFYLLGSPSELTLSQACRLSTVQSRGSKASLKGNLNNHMSTLCPAFDKYYLTPEHIRLTHDRPSGPLQSPGSDKQDVPPPSSTLFCCHHKEDPRPRPSKSELALLQRICFQQVSQSLRPLQPLLLQSLTEMSMPN